MRLRRKAQESYITPKLYAAILYEEPLRISQPGYGKRNALLGPPANDILRRACKEAR